MFASELRKRTFVETADGSRYRWQLPSHQSLSFQMERCG
jgi:hypothetical protein